MSAPDPKMQLGTTLMGGRKTAAMLKVIGSRSRSSGKTHFCAVTLTVALATLVRTIRFRVGRPLFIFGDFRKFFTAVHLLERENLLNMCILSGNEFVFTSVGDLEFRALI